MSKVSGHVRGNSCFGEPILLGPAQLYEALRDRAGEGLKSYQIASTHEEDRIGALANRATNFVSQQFGQDRKWTAINSAVWSAIRERKVEELTLADVDRVAQISSAESNEVLAVLALLSRPASELLKMEYVTNDISGKASLSKDEITKKLQLVER